MYVAQPDSDGTPRGSNIALNIKSLTMRGGSAVILTLARVLFELVTSGVARPGFIVSKDYVGLEHAPEAFRGFDQHLETQVLFELPWHDQERCADEEDIALGRERETGGELDPHGAGRSAR